MTYAMTDCQGHTYSLEGPEDARRAFDVQSTSISPWGDSAQVIWFGPAGASPQLRVDVDADADLAALTWVPDGSHAVEREPSAAITVLASADGDREVVVASKVRVSVSTARAAVVQYVESGARPTIARWQS